MSPRVRPVSSVKELGTPELRELLREGLTTLCEVEKGQSPLLLLDENQGVLFTIYPAPPRVTSLPVAHLDADTFRSFGFNAEEAAELTASGSAKTG